MGAGGPHEAQVVAAIRARRTSRGADRSHRGRRPARGSSHDPRKRGGRPRLRSHAGLAPSQSGRAGAGDTGSRFKTSTAFRVRASPWRYTRAVGTDRPDPEALLARVKAEEARQRRGKLKIFLGAAAGVGKTYSMLEAVREQKADGVDTVVGYVETHGRAETDALLAGLETLHPMTVDYRGTTLREFELDAALARHPTLILVDELAHTNAPGLRHAKRWQDVVELLDAGINVYTTMNVQHLQTINDIVQRITGIAVRETLPDSMLEQADDVELIDTSPDELLERLAEGKIYRPDVAERATRHFFNKGNLIALREMALRRTAERVDAQMLDFRRGQNVREPWAASERILVCVGPSPLSARLVRATK